ncbi:MAG TPA: hypothetical protein VEX38_02690, partial [Fimbriimonadaceae bacterium]|nr:hypothetical protein [Fimbriimonadaceae bacterium]
AEDVCLSILRRYPNNSTANILLGDIADDKGEYDRAAEWYELALDILPDSASVKEKLYAVKAKMEQQQTVEVAEQIGVPQQDSKVGLYAAFAVLALILIGLSAFIIGQNRRAGPSKPDPLINQPVVLEQGSAAKPEDDRKDTLTDLAAFPAGDRELTLALRSSAPELQVLIVAEKDPVTPSIVTMRFRLAEGEEARPVAARIAREAFNSKSLAGVNELRLRALREDRLVYYATAVRSAWEATRHEGWVKQYGDDLEALANALLTNEGPQQTASPDTPVTSQPGSTTSGSGATGSAATTGDAGGGFTGSSGSTGATSSTGSTGTGTTTGSSTTTGGASPPNATTGGTGVEAGVGGG